MIELVAIEMERNGLDQEKLKIELMGLGHGLDMRERK